MLLETQNPLESVANVPTPATSGKTDTVTPMGLDIGNGSLKLVSNQGEIRINSYVHYLSERASMPLNSGYCEYISGDRTDLIGRQWVGGINAYFHGLRSIYRVGDDAQGKADLGLQLLLSALSTLPYRADWKLFLVCSIHDGKALGSGLKKALEGKHSILIQGKRSIVTINVAAILEEGCGAIIHCQKNRDTTNALLYDLGSGTLIVSGFSGLRMTDRRYSQNGGVESLIEQIATNELVRCKLLKEGDRHLIRAGIEDRTFVYGTQHPDWSFKDSYKNELPIWAERILKPMLRPTEERAASATAMIAIGGGACLPGIEALLAKRNIQVLPDPLWANARGLYAYAVRKANSL
jgi:Actin like proteins N terminal domain